MTMVDTEEVAARPLPAVAARPDPPAPVRVEGKFFFVGDKKHFVKGVTYGPFPEGSHGAQFPECAVVDIDFALMAEAGINTVRVFTAPPVWLLDAAHQAGLRVLVGLPWSQHIAFLDSPAIQQQIREAVAAGVRACRRHPAVFAYLIGNEIPPDMVRWHGAEAVCTFLRGLVACAKKNAADSQHETARNHQPEESTSVRSESHAQSQLTRTLRHCVRHDAIEPDHGEE